jgi:predicted anti-sigma-YlaC factor YlaD
MNNSCENFSTLFSYLIDGEPIPPDSRLQLETHLNQCEKCKDELAQLKQANESIKEMMQEKLLQHISTTRLGNYSDDQIKSFSEKFEIESHLNKCKKCQKVANQLQSLNEEWAGYHKKIPSVPATRSWILKLFLKLSGFLESIKKAILTGLNIQWLQLSLATGTIALIIFLMVKVFQISGEKLEPIQKELYVEEQDSTETKKPEELVTEQQPIKEITKPDSSIEKKIPNNWERLKQVFAGNFKPTPYLEEMLAYESRSYSVKILSPEIGQKLTNEIYFKWDKTDVRIVYLKILNNQGYEIFSIMPQSNEHIYREKLTPGLYYWKLESDDDILYVGKFFMGQN